MTFDEASAKYPDLMAYIVDRNAVATDWVKQLWADEKLAVDGAFSSVAAQMEQAEADYAAYAKSLGHDEYPCNSVMGEFLGLALKANHEPDHGYYMARGVRSHFRFGEAKREAERLIAEGRELRVTIARSKADRKPVRFATFRGPDQIAIEGGEVKLNNGKRKGRLSSNWSVETCLVRLSEALRTGAPYGEAAG